MELLHNSLFVCLLKEPKVKMAILKKLMSQMKGMLEAQCQLFFVYRPYATAVKFDIR